MNLHDASSMLANDPVERPATMTVLRAGAAHDAPRPVPTLLERGIFERSQNGIDAGLVSPALSLEPFQHVRINSERNGGLRAHWLEPLAHDAADDVPYVGLGVLRRYSDLTVRHATDAG